MVKLIKACAIDAGSHELHNICKIYNFHYRTQSVVTFAKPKYLFAF
jgi:hypothetical protein